MNSRPTLTKSFVFASLLLSVTIAASTFASHRQSPINLYIFYTQQSSTNDSFIKQLSSSLHTRMPSYRVQAIQLKSQTDRQLETLVGDNNHCTITVGAEALKSILAVRNHAPIFSTMVAKTTLDTLIASYQRLGSVVTGIYQEQSFRRQIHLAKALNNNTKNIILYLGNKTRYNLADYLAISKEESIQLDYRILKHQLAPQTSLAKYDEKNAFMLIVNDSEHHTPQKLQSILLTSYKKQIPLIGAKSSDTQNAAIASVVTPTAQLAEEVADEMATVCRGKKIPAAHYSGYFSVMINPQIANYLNFANLSADRLNNIIHQQEKLNKEAK